MAGRVRHGTENLYIIVDSCGYSKEDYKHESRLSRDYLAPDVRKITSETDLTQWAVNAHLQDLCNAQRPDFFANRDSEFLPYHDKETDIGSYISFVQNNLNYVRFDHFRNHFSFYYLKAVARRYLNQQNQKFLAASQDHSKYAEMFQKVFPTAIAHPYKDRLDQMREYVESLLADNPERTFTTEELKAHRAELNSIRFDKPTEYLEKMNVLLEPFGFMVKRVSKDSKKPGYNRWRFCQIVPQQLAS